MSESLVVGPESRRRVRRSIMTFLGLSAPGVVGSVAVEMRDPNAFSYSQSLMNVFDWVIGVTMIASEKLDAHGWHKSAQVGRVALAATHTLVALKGAESVFERLGTQESASAKSLLTSLSVAGFSLAAIAYERHKDKKQKAPETTSDLYHELNRGMARRLFQTKLGEAAFTAVGVSAQMMTTAEHPTTGIAAIAALGTTVSVAWPMGSQAWEEWKHRVDLGEERPDESIEKVAA